MPLKKIFQCISLHVQHTVEVKMADAQAAPCICFEYGAVYGCTVGGFVLAMAWDWWTDKKGGKQLSNWKAKDKKRS